MAPDQAGALAAGEPGHAAVKLEPWQARVMALTVDGLTVPEIAKRLGVTQHTVYTARYEARLAAEGRPRKRKRKPYVAKARPLQYVHDSETLPEAKRRITDGIRRKERCPRCHLLLPCGHEEITVGALAVKRRPVDVL